MRKQNGITLIALVVTIIVLLILAGVSITSLMDDNNGVITKAKDAAEKVKEAEAKEKTDIQKIMDYIDEEYRNIDVEVSQTQGENLWNSIVTLNFLLEQEDYTLEQKRNIAAFLTDFTTEEFMSLFSGDGYTYEDTMTELGGEEIVLDEIIDVMKTYISYKDIAKLESLGIKVITVKTPYNTTLYTSSLNNIALECGFVENGTYTFDISSGGTKISKTVKINNIRNYDTQGPHEVKIDYYQLSSTANYDIDSSGTYTALTSGTYNVNDSIDFQYTDQFYLVNKNKEYYKYFSNDRVWRRWTDNENGYMLAWAAYGLAQNLPEEMVKKITARQVILYLILSGEEEHYVNHCFEAGDGEWLDCMDLVWVANYRGESLDSEALLEKYPKLGISVSESYNSNYILDINADTHINVVVRTCFTVDTYVEVVIWDDEKKKKIRIRKKVKDITYDDELLVWDFDKGEFTTAKPLYIMKPQVTNSYNLLKFSDGSELKTINQHRIFNKEAGKFTYPMTDETPIGTTTFNAEGKEVTLVSKEVITVKEVEYMNIITDYHMNLFAGNILTSCRLSNLYEIKDMKYIKDNRELASKEEYPNIPEEYFNGLRIAEQPKEINRGNDVKFDNSLEEYVQRLINSKK